MGYSKDRSEVADDTVKNLTLTDEQRAVVEHIEGAVLVLAMVGSGKTLVMAKRLARALETGLDPRSAVCLTFTNRAARAIRDRVAGRLGDAAREVFCGTFHRFCAEILRVDGELLGIPRSFVIIDEQDGAEILLELAKRDAQIADLCKQAAAFTQRSQQHGLTADTTRQVWNAISRRKTQVAGGNHGVFRCGLSDSELEHLQTAYDQELAGIGALDFADLIRYVLELFQQYPERREYWQNRFRWMQVDEVQDTHMSEYAVIAEIMRPNRDLAFFGDVDQTIYEWRGSRPTEVLDRFEREFAPVTRYELSENFRATKVLIRVADEAAALIKNRQTQVRPAACLPEGDPVDLVVGTVSEQGAYIAQVLARTGEPASCCVLVRTRRMAEDIARAIKACNQKAVTVDAYEFFRRQEVKDAIALARVVLNRWDDSATGRALLRPPRGLGEKGIMRLRQEGPHYGLRLSDVLRSASYDYGDPFGRLFDAWDNGDLVVFDVETTGLNPMTDEVIEFSAVRVRKGKVTDRLHLFVRPTHWNEEAAGVHHLVRDEVESTGFDAKDAFTRIRNFFAGAHVVGHNVVFDLEMLYYHGLRAGVPVTVASWDDTLDLARRLLAEPRYDLAYLADKLALAHRPEHRAHADVDTTVELLGELLRRLAGTRVRREAMLKQVPSEVRDLAGVVESLRVSQWQARPDELFSKAIQQSRLAAYYRKEIERKRNLEELVDRVRRLATFTCGWGRPALQEVLHLTGLARNVDFIDPSEGIPVLPVHQAKGLQFDTVFVAGLGDGVFPLKKHDEAEMNEEHRIFYVAVTRARRKLVLLGEYRRSLYVEWLINHHGVKKYIRWAEW